MRKYIYILIITALVLTSIKSPRDHMRDYRAYVVMQKHALTWDDIDGYVYRDLSSARSSTLAAFRTGTDEYHAELDPDIKRFLNWFFKPGNEEYMAGLCLNSMRKNDFKFTACEDRIAQYFDKHFQKLIISENDYLARLGDIAESSIDKSGVRIAASRNAPEELGISVSEWNTLMDALYVDRKPFYFGYALLGSMSVYDILKRPSGKAILASASINMTDRAIQAWKFWKRPPIIFTKRQPLIQRVLPSNLSAKDVAEKQIAGKVSKNVAKKTATKVVAKLPTKTGPQIVIGVVISVLAAAYDRNEMRKEIDDGFAQAADAYADSLYDSGFGVLLDAPEFAADRFRRWGWLYETIIRSSAEKPVQA